MHQRSLHLFSSLFGVLVLATASSTALASGDSIRIGNSRAAGMGGAGLALPVGIPQSYRLNPAMLALHKRSFGIQTPTLGAYSTGFSFRKIGDTVDAGKGAGDSTDEATKIARELGGKNFDLGADLSLGLVFANFAVSGGGEALLSSRPNQALQDYIANNPNGDFTGLNNGERLDAYGLAHYSINVAGAHNFQMNRGELAVGLQLRQVTAHYAHKFADQNAIENSQEAENAAEMGGRDSLRKTGLGVDLGLLYKVPDLPRTYVGLSVENFITPNISFERTNQNGNFTSKVRPFNRITSVGIGATLDNGLLLAADVYDVFGAGPGKDLRFGAELPLGKSWSVRAGYNTRTAWTIGVDFAGLNLTLGGRAPLTVSTGVRF